MKTVDQRNYFYSCDGLKIAFSSFSFTYSDKSANWLNNCFAILSSNKVPDKNSLCNCAIRRLEPEIAHIFYNFNIFKNVNLAVKTAKLSNTKKHKSYFLFGERFVPCYCNICRWTLFKPSNIICATPLS